MSAPVTLRTTSSTDLQMSRRPALRRSLRRFVVGELIVLRELQESYLVKQRPLRTPGLDESETPSTACSSFMRPRRPQSWCTVVGEDPVAAGTVPRTPIDYRDDPAVAQWQDCGPGL